MYRPGAIIRDHLINVTQTEKRTLSNSLLESLGEYFLPLSIVINDAMDIVFVRNRNPYIVHASGVMTTNVFKSIHESLSLELRTLIHECSKDDTAQVGVYKSVELFEGVIKLVRLIVMPLKYHSETGKLFVVSFQEESPEMLYNTTMTKASEGNEEAKRLEAELLHTKNHLQTVIEELDLSNEELQSLNEEMQSTNEELQSTNEELETTNEELQGTNEELQIAYTELKTFATELEESKKKTEELNEQLGISTQIAKDNESKAIKSMEFSDELIESTNAMVVVLDEDGAIIRFNKRLEEFCGYSKAEALGKNWISMFIAKEYQEECKRNLKNMLYASVKSLWQHECHMVLKDKTERLISWQHSMFMDSEYRRNIISFGIDITDRDLASRQIKLQEEYLNAIVNSQNTISIITDGENLLDANRAFFQFFDEFESIEAFREKHKCVCDYFEKVDQPDFIYEGKDGKSWIEQMSNYNIHKALIKKNDKEHFFILRLSEFGNTMDNRKIISMTDVTELEDYRLLLEKKISDEVVQAKIQEQLMVQQGKLAAMGEMLGAIAHQWRQPLNTLGIIVQDVEAAFEFNELDKTYITKFKTDSMRLIKHMSKTIDDFRDFFKPASKNEMFNMQECLDESFEIYSGLLKTNEINVESTASKEDCEKIFGNKNQLKQVFLNIISNAKDAILEAKLADSSFHGLIRTRIYCQDGFMFISIWDNAAPVTGEVIKRVFEPYFITKEQGKGTGIGLYMSKIIVEQNLKGSIFMQNIDGGVEMVVKIPMAHQS
jgi:PAS domain S-box-containing protein